MSDTSILSDITQIVTALGVILTAISSILNRLKIDKLQTNIVVKSDEVKQAVQETKDVAIAVNAEVVKEVHDVGVAAGQAIANGGAPK